jgi:hypothetical protein
MICIEKIVISGGLNILVLIFFRKEEKKIVKSNVLCLYMCVTSSSSKPFNASLLNLAQTLRNKKVTVPPKIISCF